LGGEKAKKDIEKPREPSKVCLVLYQSPYFVVGNIDSNMEEFYHFIV
jgi:hypothetical protein